MKRRLIALLVAAMMALTIGAPAALAGGMDGGGGGGGDGDGKKAKKCNAGRGNGSELVRGRDCDPGNSGGNNQGGD